MANAVYGALSPWAKVGAPLNFDYNSGVDPKPAIASRFESIASHIKPGDSLIIYYGGHSSDSGNGLAITSGNVYSASEIASVLSDSRFAGVNKIVIDDSCDAADAWFNGLSAQSDIGFIGASGVHGQQYMYAWANPDPNSPTYGQGYMTQAIIPALTPGATFDSILAAAINNAPQDTVSGFVEDDVPTGVTSGFERPSAYMSGDFNPDVTFVAVPEPSALALAALALPGIALMCSRKKKK